MSIFAEVKGQGYMIEQKTINSLTHCPLFYRMSEMEITDALDSISHKIIHFKKHDIYAIAGFEYPHADIVLHGNMTARMVAVSSGRQLEVIQLQKGDVIAPNFIFADKNVMPVTIETECEVRILRMSSRSLQHLVDTYATIRWNFISILSNIGAYLASKMKFISLLTIKEKVKFYLRAEALAQRSKVITLGKSRQHLADSFAIQKFSLIRCLAELAEDGSISIHSKEITILDIRKLQI